MSQKFQRKIEDFVCEHCGADVKGSGYTNHCPKCLWSKHVDVFPGDRAEKCGGMMKLIALEKRGKDYVLTHQCVSCGEERKIKLLENDNFEEVLKIVRRSQK